MVKREDRLLWILIHQKTGKKLLIKTTDDDFHTEFGTIPASSLKSEGIVKSAKGDTFLLIKPHFSDLLESIQRGPQVMIHKDIGWIITKTGITKDSIVVDAGGGSGMLCFTLAGLCKQVVVYEHNPAHVTILEKNKQFLGVKNIIIKQGDIAQGSGEKNVDVITLDLPEPWLVLDYAEKALLEGGFVVVYLPNLLQVKQFIDAADKTKIKVLETIELWERKWKTEDNIMRPEFQMLGHTGFLTLCRKI